MNIEQELRTISRRKADNAEQQESLCQKMDAAADAYEIVKDDFKKQLDRLVKAAEKLDNEEQAVLAKADKVKPKPRAKVKNQ